MSEFALDEVLEVGADGRPRNPVRLLALDALHAVPKETVAAAAASVRRSPILTIGVCHLRPPPSLAPLLDAATVTLAPPTVAPTRQIVTVIDAEVSAEDLMAAVTARPQAAVALGQLLEQTDALPTHAGLAAEAAVYSMLLGGSGFADWVATAPRPGGTASEADPLEVRREGDVLEIALARPERRNALSFSLRDRLYEALEVAVLDDTVAQVRISGAGPVFCSGGDLSEFGTAEDLVAAYLVRLTRAPWSLIDRLADRTAVHVHGAAIGAGIEMAAFAGRVTCDPHTRFRLPEIGMGLVPGAGGSVSVTRRIGRWRAAWMMLTGADVDAFTALDWGLVDEIVAR